ncbi:hypothetical protein GWI72_10410 [Microvirga tunisiensis]|uniref:Uncharacterized protein n=1 Tax=Pannonibacter tanglangensis TaxID=2750084 RepID=A0A7X5F2Q1_9HYPH|nr:gene transfer agent family protein [Pannonibacter sp. XCT-53]NBN78678.1 hypothetical protein [Pannonibacter sp. XCT-53]
MTDRLSSGEVSITLGGRERVLRPTLDAARKINAKFGGFTQVYQQFVQQDFAALTYVLAAGLNAKRLQETIDEIEPQVFAGGLFTGYGEAAIKFLRNLTAGGRDADAVAETEEPDDGDADPE